jgi:hypothetical protein
MAVVDTLTQLATDCNGKINEVQDLGDGSGFAVMSMDLPKDHWLYKKSDTGYNAPPMPFRMGGNGEIHISIWNESEPGRTITLSREQFDRAIVAAGRYAVKCATMDGTENDFDPDALVQNLRIAFAGYYTENGLTDDDWANPKEPFDFSKWPK